MTHSALPTWLAGACRRPCAWSLVFALFAALSGCAVGLPPPAETPMVQVAATPNFWFGFGDKGCKIPQDVQACTTAKSAGKKFNPGTPSHAVAVAAFALDSHEVTVEQYRYCVDMGTCSLPAGYNGPPGGASDYYLNDKYNKNPVIWVSWDQATEYCAFVGKRLPTEFEWERAASGPSQDPALADKRVFPTSIAPTPGPASVLPASCDGINIPACSHGTADTRPVATSANDVVTENGQQIFDLAGNIAEWTASDDDDAARGYAATCDWSGGTTTYDCTSCVACLRTANKDADCATQCFGCKCGPSGSDPKAAGYDPKASCYQPCAAPICPKYPDSPALTRDYSTTHKTDKRIIRGGSFLAGSDPDCEDRFDYRGFSLKPSDGSFAHLGFRCARSL